MKNSLSKGSWKNAPYLLNNMETGDEFLTLLSEAMAWCNHVNTSEDTAGEKYRSEELNPFHDKEVDYLDECDDIEKEVKKLIEDRKHHIRTNEICVSDIESVRKESILFTDVECTVLDGASQDESNGYFDIGDCPPWDTWVCYGYQDWADSKNNIVLISWVPDDCIENMKSGIYINCVGCIYSPGYSPEYLQEYYEDGTRDSPISDQLERWGIFRNS